MKKVYIKPELLVLSGGDYTENLMATSGVYGDNGIGYGGVDDGTHDPAAKKNYSSHFEDEENSNNFWDDDD